MVSVRQKPGPSRTPSYTLVVGCAEQNTPGFGFTRAGCSLPSWGVLGCHVFDLEPKKLTARNVPGTFCACTEIRRSAAIPEITSQSLRDSSTRVRCLDCARGYSITIRQRATVGKSQCSHLSMHHNTPLAVTPVRDRPRSPHVRLWVVVRRGRSKIWIAFILASRIHEP